MRKLLQTASLLAFLALPLASAGPALAQHDLDSHGGGERPMMDCSDCPCPMMKDGKMRHGKKGHHKMGHQMKGHGMMDGGRMENCPMMGPPGDYMDMPMASGKGMVPETPEMASLRREIDAQRERLRADHAQLRADWDKMRELHAQMRELVQKAKMPKKPSKGNAAPRTIN